MDIVFVLLKSSNKNCATIKAKETNTSKTYAMSCKWLKNSGLCIASEICFYKCQYNEILDNIIKNDTYIVLNEELSDNYANCKLL